MRRRHPNPSEALSWSFLYGVKALQCKKTELLAHVALLGSRPPFLTPKGWSCEYHPDAGQNPVRRLAVSLWVWVTIFSFGGWLLEGSGKEPWPGGPPLRFGSRSILPPVGKVRVWEGAILCQLCM